MQPSHLVTREIADLFDRGRAANSAGRPAEAERLLRRGLELLSVSAPAGVPTSDPGSADHAADSFPSVAGGQASTAEARIRLLVSLSSALIERRGAGAALRTAHEALAEAQRTDDAVRRPLVAICHSQLAMLHGRSGQTTQALAELELAADGLHSLGARERFVILLSRGMLRLDLPDVDAAAGDFAAAAELAAEHRLVRQEFMARHNLGLATALGGDLPRALTIMHETERLPVDISLGVAWHARATVLLDAGLISEAVDLLERSAAAAAEEGQRLQAGQSLVDLARGRLLLGDVEAALATARRAERTLGSLAPGLRRRAALVQQQARLRTDAAAARVATRCVTLARGFAADGDHVAADLARLLAAEALTLRARHTEALELLDSSADLARVGSLSTRLRTRTVLAAAARAGGERDEARRLVRAALRDLATAVHASASLELRSATTVQARELAQLDLQLAGERPAARLAAVERWAEVAWRAPAVRPPADPDLARRTTALRHLRQQVSEDPGRADRLRERMRTLERQVAAASWASAGRAGTRGDVVSTTRAREQLSAHDAVAVSYVEQDGRLGAAVVGGRRVRWVDLGPADAVHETARRFAADLEARTRVATGPMVPVVETALATSARRLDELLLAPLRLGGRLVVVPTPGLVGVAWGMLPSRAGLPTTVAPTLGTWVRGARQVAAPRAAVVAGPGLPGAVAECVALAPVWGAVPPHALSTSTDLVAGLVGADLVHVAAHGSHRSDSPLFSSVWLSDGPMFLADLERVERTASHVVVSACEAGRGQARGGAATLGLASGLLSLGVGSVLASPCRVPDLTASAVMPAYHRLLAAGRPVDEAVSEAAGGCDLPLAGAFVAWGSPWRVEVPSAVASAGPGQESGA